MKALFLTTVAIPFFLSASEGQLSRGVLGEAVLIERLNESQTQTSITEDAIQEKLRQKYGRFDEDPKIRSFTTYSFTIQPSPNSHEEVMLGFPLTKYQYFVISGSKTSCSIRKEKMVMVPTTREIKSSQLLTPLKISDCITPMFPLCFRIDFPRRYAESFKRQLNANAAKYEKLKALFDQLMEQNRKNPSVTALALKLSDLN